MLVQPEQLELDSNVRRSSNGTALFGGSPFRLVRLSPAGANLVTAWLAGNHTKPTSAANALRHRLVSSGILHPRITPSTQTPSAAVVVPVFDDVAGLDNVLSDLRRELADTRIVVVDDFSADAAAIGAVAARHGAELLRHEHNRGPGAARNTGLAHLGNSASVVVFVDADVSCTRGSVDLLLAHFVDPSVVAVAPRMQAEPGLDLIDEYEAARSPLDLGREPALVRPRSKVSYVPSAGLVVRTSAIQAIGGFDESLRLGEDVDMVWRLASEDQVIRYEPRAVFRHRNRSDVPALLRQRYGYGTSAAQLDKRHAGQVAPVDLPAATFATWLAAVFGGPLGRLVAVAGAGVLGWQLRDKLDGKVDDPTAQALHLTARGHGHAVKWLASACRRAWAPLLLLTSPTRRALFIAHLGAAGVEWVSKRPAADPLTFTALSVADDTAYCAGVWTGALRERSAAALLPRLRWPTLPSRDR